MNGQDTYDVIVIGSGPGGFAASIRASQLGLKACVIEKGPVGGVCVNEGCIPTKSLVHQAAIFAGQDDLARMGIAFDSGGFNYQAVFEQSRNAAELVSKGVRFQLDRQKIDLYEQAGRIISPAEVSLADGSIISGKNIIIATGSQPRELPLLPFDETIVLSSSGALHLTELPSSILIVGGGSIGCEFAHIFSTFGTKVTLIEMANHILPGIDTDITTVLMRSFRRAGVTVKTGAHATGMSCTENGVAVTVEDGKGSSVIEAEKVLVSVGRAPNTGNIGLETVGLKTEHGGIPAGDYFRTAVPNIYAIGDVTGGSLLAHTATRAGEIAAEAIAGIPTESGIDPLRIPAAVFTAPPAATFGVSETMAKEQDIPYKKATTQYRGGGKAVADGVRDGLVKVLLSPDAKAILGAAVIGESAPEIIHELLLAATTETNPADLGRMIHIHPTFSELAREVMRSIDPSTSL